MSLSIGIPKALHYYTFIPLWERFFYELGLKVVESGPTNKEIVDLGVKTTVTDACAPIKIFQGHAEALVGRADAMFIPRMVSFEGGYVFCPKFLGLPDMVRATVENLPPVIDTRFDLRKGPASLLRALTQLGIQLGAGRLKALSASIRAIRHFKQAGWTGYLRKGLTSESSTKKLPVTIAVIGYPYIVHDPYLNCGMVDFLKEAGVQVVTMEDVPTRDIERESGTLTKDVFWHYSNRALKAAYHLMKHRSIDGVVHVTAFGCGPDAVVDKFLELDCRYEYGVPFLSMTVDEHSGQAGVVTRLEAFLDMILRKKGVVIEPRQAKDSQKVSKARDDIDVDEPILQGRQVS